MRSILLVLFLSVFSFFVKGEETRIIVRAKAKDAKFIGSSLGGAYVVIRDKKSGEILAKGKTEGTTGNTKLIMQDPQQRRKAIADPATAKFEAALDLKEPTFIKIEVMSPANNRSAQVAASTEMWLIPGKHILGDGVVLEIPGFIIDILSPRTHQYISLKSLIGNKLKVQANIVMMCGCLIENEGLWDAQSMESKIVLKRNGRKLLETDLACVATNLFETTLNIDTTGDYELIVYAYDPITGNTGVEFMNFVLLP